MGYQKTAKDLAWDRERAKLKSEIAQWQDKFAKAQSIISAQEQEMLAYECENSELREAVEKLTDGKKTADEVLADMRKTAELSDMVGFLFKHSSLTGLY
jgi:ATP phosphoribosyltransferase